MRQPTTIDLSQLPPPQLVEALDAERYIAAWIADFRARWPQFTAMLESEPVIKLMEVGAYRETLKRNEINHAGRAVMVAFAAGSDLDHVGANLGVERMLETPATDTTPAVYESDARFRRRIQLAPESFSVAGPAGAYEFHALTLDLAVFDVHAFTPSQQRGEVHVVIAGKDGEAVSDDLLTRAARMFSREDIVPLTDVVTVRRAGVVAYSVTGTLRLQRGPDPATIHQDAVARLRTYAAERYSIGATVYRSGIIAAAKAPGVENVEISGPAADIVCERDQIPLLGEITLATEIA